VGQIAEEFVAEWIVPKVLDDASSVGVRMPLVNSSAVANGNRLSSNGRIALSQVESMIAS
jgi:hypothetical protein